MRPCTSEFEFTCDAYTTEYWGWFSVRIILPDEDTGWVHPRHGATISASYHVEGADVTSTYLPRYAWNQIKVTLHNGLLSLYVNNELKSQVNVNYPTMDKIGLYGPYYIKNIDLKYKL